MNLSRSVLSILSCLFDIVSASATANRAPISLTPAGNPQQNQKQIESYPLTGSGQGKTQQQIGEKAQQTQGDYRFPATRQELEQAASDCDRQVQALWSQKAQLPRYRQPLFQRSIGDAQQRCRKLKELAETIKLADEQLYTYQQCLGQAEHCFAGG